MFHRFDCSFCLPIALEVTWAAGTLLELILSSERAELSTVLANWGPLSDTTFAGMPWMAKILERISMMLPDVVEHVSSAMKWEKWSTIIR